MHDELPITRVRNTYTSIGVKVKSGLQRAQLVGKTIQFAISELDTMEVRVLKTTGSGIAQDNDGNITITLLGTDLSRTTLPKTEYWYEVRLLDEAGEPHALKYGRFTLRDSPFAA
jgi:hypothetical protein